jgi:TM2 domain-containing membrane protein YozV
MITKEKFLKVCNENQPSRFCVFVFRYFSTERVKTDEWLRWYILGYFFLFFIAGFVSVILDNRTISGIATLIFCSSLIILAVVLISAVIINNRRIKRIVKTLGITQAEYLSYVDIWL